MQYRFATSIIWMIGFTCSTTSLTPMENSVYVSRQCAQLTTCPSPHLPVCSPHSSSPPMVRGTTSGHQHISYHSHDVPSRLTMKAIMLGMILPNNIQPAHCAHSSVPYAAAGSLGSGPTRFASSVKASIDRTYSVPPFRPVIIVPVCAAAPTTTVVVLGPRVVMAVAGVATVANPETLLKYLSDEASSVSCLAFTGTG